MPLEVRDALQINDQILAEFNGKELVITGLNKESTKKPTKTISKNCEEFNGPNSVVVCIEDCGSSGPGSIPGLGPKGDINE